MSDSLWPHGLQHIVLPCPSLSPRVCSNSYPLSEWCHLIISSSVAPLFSSSQSFPASWSFPVSQFFRWWPKYWNFSFCFSLSNEYSGLISFRIDWFDFLATMELSTVFSSTTIQNIISSVLNLFYGPTLTSVHDYWKNHSFDYTDLCQQSVVYAF